MEAVATNQSKIFDPKEYSHNNQNDLDIVERNKIITPYTLENLNSDLKKTKEGLLTGYEELDKIVRIPNEAITLIGGRPSHGKTTLMLNILLNQIELYPDRHFYFFSYEETLQQIAVKIINILGGHIFDSAQNLLQLTGYLKSEKTQFSKVEQAKNKYSELIDSGRLRIVVGDPYYVQDFEPAINKLKSCGVPLGAVFIDYIQKIKNKERFNSRLTELQKTSERLLETAKSCSIPIILGAQFGRDKDSKDKVRSDNLRECGDFEQDANVILGLFNPSMEKAQDGQKQPMARTIDISVTPLKNRNGGSINQEINLEFDRPILTIKNKVK